MLGLAIPTPNTLPFHVNRVSASNSVVVEPTVTSSFSVALFRAVTGADGRLVKLLPSPINFDACMLPPATTCPNEPVEVDEPVTFPLVVMVPNVGVAEVWMFCGVESVIVPSPSSATEIWLEVPATKLFKSDDTNFLLPFVDTNLEAVKSSNVILSNVTSADVSKSCGVDKVILPAPFVTVT